jgi:hypothetical protein
MCGRTGGGEIGPEQASGIIAPARLRIGYGSVKLRDARGRRSRPEDPFALPQRGDDLDDGSPREEAVLHAERRREGRYLARGGIRDLPGPEAFDVLREVAQRRAGDLRVGVGLSGLRVPDGVEEALGPAGDAVAPSRGTSVLPSPRSSSNQASGRKPIALAMALNFS